MSPFYLMALAALLVLWWGNCRIRLCLLVPSFLRKRSQETDRQSTNMLKRSNHVRLGMQGMQSHTCSCDGKKGEAHDEPEG